MKSAVDPEFRHCADHRYPERYLFLRLHRGSSVGQAEEAGQQEDRAGPAEGMSFALSKKDEFLKTRPFLYIENHSLGEWFQKAYGDEKNPC